jgi:hypothetical protein
MELNFRLAEFGAKILTRKCTEELKQTFWRVWAWNKC